MNGENYLKVIKKKDEIMKENVRVRFAPSPTGFLHMGGARTALFNWLFARHNKGTFILRIEDTDVVRSSPETTEAILSDLEWLKISWDEGPKIGGKFGPYFQSQRTEIYKKYAKMLLQQDKAYYCYCTPRELEERREKAKSQGKSFKYDQRCRNLTAADIKNFEKEGRKKVIRFKKKYEETIVVDDEIRGKIKFDASLLDDFVIMKSDGMPVYNFSAVIDDALMQINYVIRGDDHLSNTPRQILLYKALNFPLPSFAHLPMILGPDGTLLSKRHGATSIHYYKDKGFLPEAMINFLARLGWAYDDKQEIFSPKELIEKFTLDKVSKNPAIFDMKKLEWLNSYYLRQMSDEEMLNLIIPFWEKAGFKEEIKSFNNQKLKEIARIIKERIKTLKEGVEITDFFFQDEIEIKPEVEEKFLNQDYAKELLKKFHYNLSQIEFKPDEVVKALQQVVEEMELKKKVVFQTLRVILTGKTVSPPLLESILILGKERVRERIKRCLLQKQS